MPKQQVEKFQMARLSQSFRGALRTFSFWIANRTVGLDVLQGIDYSCIFQEPSALEAVYAIFANVIELDAAGNVLNAKWAEHRAAQYIRQTVTGTPADPPIQGWECELYAPPGRRDILPWPNAQG